jgi:hypothetical protein
LNFRKCFEQLLGYCPRCSEVIRKVSNETGVSQLVQNIADAYNKFLQVVPNSSSSSAAQIPQSQSFDALKDDYTSSYRRIANNCESDILNDTAKNNKGNISVLVDQSIRVATDGEQDFSIATISLEQSQIPFSSFITPSQDMPPTDTLRTFSSTCADWIHDVGKLNI